MTDSSIVRKKLVFVSVQKIYIFLLYRQKIKMASF